MATGPQDKKAHHVVPETYLKRWADGMGKIFAYRKDSPNTPLHVLPKNIAVINKYYSQPLPGGGWDHNSLEDLFDRQVESNWTPVVEKIIGREILDMPSLVNLFKFICASHVRVPVARDAVEVALAKMVQRSFLDMNKEGMFPKPPAVLRGKMHLIEAAIDPHRSILAMRGLANALENLIDIIGFRIVVNRTKVPWITSDNPVAFFDPRLTGHRARPFRVRPNGPIELYFTIDPHHMVHGHTDFKADFDASGLLYYDEADEKVIGKINATVARYAYQMVFTSTKEHAKLIHKFSGKSPVIDNRPFRNVTAKVITERMIFGPRKQKQKWKNENK